MSQLQVSRINDASGGVLAPISSVMRNRIINGAMVIDQRNAGAAVSVSGTTSGYCVDRFQYFASGGGAYTLQQSTVVPSGFKNSLLVTVTTADSSIASGDYYWIQQQIEGFNTADLNFGTASASAITVSFWVRSSLTGTFSGGIENQGTGGNRGYAFNFTINAANTFEYKTVTIAGDTAGTWLTDNSTGLSLTVNLGSGSSRLATAGSWVGARAVGATGSVNLIGTNGATFYITGVQLEVGTQATSFEYRQYGTELNLCQRYFQVIAGGPPDSTAARNEMVAVGMQFTSTEFYYTLRFIQEMRVAPTFTLTGNIRYYRGGGSATTTSAVFEGTTIRAVRIFVTGSGGAASDATWLQMGGFENDRIAASAEL